MNAHHSPGRIVRRMLQHFVGQLTEKDFEFLPPDESAIMRTEDIPERKIQKTEYIAPVFLCAASLREEEPCAWIPVVTRQQKLLFRNIENRGARRRSGTCDHPDSKITQLQVPLPENFHRSCRSGEVFLLINDDTGILRFPENVPAPALLCIFLERLLFLFQKKHRIKIAGSQRMIVVRMGQDNLQRKGRPITGSKPCTSSSP